MILREDQKLPIDYWQNWILIGGRGSGKTTAACMGIEQLIKTNRYKKIGFIGTTLFDSKTLMVEENFLKYITGYVYQRSNRKIIVNNTIIYLFGGDKYNSLRGFEFDLIWIDELAKFKYSKEILEQIYLCLRKGESKLIITSTPMTNNYILNNLINNPHTKYINNSSLINNHLSENFKINTQYLNKEIYKQEVEGVNISKTFLWTEKDIKYYTKSIQIEKYYLGIDPAISSGTTGIILCGKNFNGDIIILEDYSTTNNSLFWFDIIKQLSNYKNICIYIEINQGGDLFDHLAKLHHIKVPIIKKYTKYSKFHRAVMTFNWYKEFPIYHKKKLLDLEHQMFFNTHKRDRIDALHWCLNFL